MIFDFTAFPHKNQYNFFGAAKYKPEVPCITLDGLSDVIRVTTNFDDNNSPMGHTISYGKRYAGYTLYSYFHYPFLKKDRILTSTWCTHAGSFSFFTQYFDDSTATRACLDTNGNKGLLQNNGVVEWPQANLNNYRITAPPATWCMGFTSKAFARCPKNGFNDYWIDHICFDFNNGQVGIYYADGSFIWPNANTTDCLLMPYNTVYTN